MPSSCVYRLQDTSAEPGEGILYDDIDFGNVPCSAVNYYSRQELEKPGGVGADSVGVLQSYVVLGRHTKLPAEHRIYNESISRNHCSIAMMTEFDAFGILEKQKKDDLADWAAKHHKVAGAGGGGAATTPSHLPKPLKHWEWPRKDQLLKNNVLLVSVTGRNGVLVNEAFVPKGRKVMLKLGDSLQFLGNEISDVMSAEFGKEGSFVSQTSTKPVQTSPTPTSRYAHHTNSQFSQEFSQEEGRITPKSSRTHRVGAVAAGRSGGRVPSSSPLCGELIEVACSPHPDRVGGIRSSTTLESDLPAGRPIVACHRVNKTCPALLNRHPLPTFTLRRRSPSPEAGVVNTMGKSKGGPLRGVPPHHHHHHHPVQESLTPASRWEEESSGRTQKKRGIAAAAGGAKGSKRNRDEDSDGGGSQASGSSRGRELSLSSILDDHENSAKRTSASKPKPKASGKWRL